MGSEEIQEDTIFSNPGRMYRPDVSSAIVGQHLAHMVEVLARFPQNRILGCHIDSIHLDTTRWDPWPVLEQLWAGWKIEAEGRCAFLGVGNYCYWDEDGRKVKSASENRAKIVPGENITASLLFREWSNLPNTEDIPRRLRNRPGQSLAMPYRFDMEDYPIYWPLKGWPVLTRWTL